MNCRNYLTTAALLAALAMLSTSTCAADEVTFPAAGGDLASGWGDLTPGSSDTVVISQGGTYTAADQDVSFGNV